MRIAVLLFVLICASQIYGQNITKDFVVGTRPRIEIENRFGQVRVVADEKLENKVLLEIASPNGAIEEDEIIAQAVQEGKVFLSVNETQKRVDLMLRVPVQVRLNVVGSSGMVEIAGNFESVEVSTDTGTIFADVPIDALKFDFLWTESRPRYLSDFEIPAPKEKAGGKFTISGKMSSDKSSGSNIQTSKSDKTLSETEFEDESLGTKNKKLDNRKISLNFTTKRGVILLNVPPSHVPSDLRERPLTNAAKAIIKSGDSILSEAIRRVAPKHFGAYLKTLPNRRLAPHIVSRELPASAPPSQIDVLQRVNVNVADKHGRAINKLKAADFTLLENGEPTEIVKIEATTTPFNLVLLLDVSGSVEERIDFIRKAARNFVNTVGANDKLAIIAFRNDVHVISDFTVDKISLSQSLDTFEAGGGTALYDSLAYVLADTLRPLKGERTAIVILSDGDDNRSFIGFEPLLSAIQESGALVYPLYVASGLIPQNNQSTSLEDLDPLRTKYLTLTSKAEMEARRLAEVSGGLYFPLRRLEEFQKAYDDVVAQLRTAYGVTYRSKIGSQRLHVSVKPEGAFVRTGTPVRVQ